MVTTNNMLLSYKEEAICYVFKEKKMVVMLTIMKRKGNKVAKIELIS